MAVARLPIQPIQPARSAKPTSQLLQQHAQSSVPPSPAIHPVERTARAKKRVVAQGNRAAEPAKPNSAGSAWLFWRASPGNDIMAHSVNHRHHRTRAGLGPCHHCHAWHALPACLSACLRARIYGTPSPSPGLTLPSGRREACAVCRWFCKRARPRSTSSAPKPWVRNPPCPSRGEAEGALARAVRPAATT